MTDQIDAPVEDEADAPEAAAPQAAAPERAKPTKAERLEAKAARLREAEARRAEAAAAAQDAGPRRRPTGLIVAVTVLAVLATALATLLTVGFISWKHQRDLQSARSDVLESARRFAVQFGTYDYQKLDQQFAAVATHLTPDFRANYLKSSRGLKATIVQYKGKSVASVAGIGVTSAGESKASVVVFLDQTVTNTQSTVPTVDRNRLLIQLERHHGEWQIKAIWPK